MNSSTDTAARGLARYAARMGRPLGGAYREDCRAYPAIVGSYSTYADAYDDERNAMKGDR
jgi:hypothetical protein